MTYSIELTEDELSLLAFALGYFAGHFSAPDEAAKKATLERIGRIVRKVSGAHSDGVPKETK